MLAAAGAGRLLYARRLLWESRQKMVVAEK
jgi:hypothetical protein